MKHLTSLSVLSLSLVLLPVAAQGEAWLTVDEQARADCLAELHITEEQSSTNTYRLSVTKCIRGKLEDTEKETRRDRVSARAQQFSGTVRMRTRDQAEARATSEATARHALREQMQSRQTIRSRQEATFVNNLRNKVSTVKDFSTREERAKRSQQLQEMQAKARAMCTDAPSGKRANCVRDALRTLGTATVPASEE